MHLSNSSPTVQLVNRATGKTSQPAIVTGNVAEFSPAPAGRWDGLLIDGAYQPMNGPPLFLTEHAGVLRITTTEGDTP